MSEFEAAYHEQKNNNSPRLIKINQFSWLALDPGLSAGRSARHE